MKLIASDEKKIESNKKSDKVKLVMLVLATFSGLLLSFVSIYLNIDFIELIKVFSENISNPEVIDKIVQILVKWYIYSFSMVIAALLLFGIYFACHRKKNEEDVLTWGQTLIFMIVLILILQSLLPLYSFTVLIVIALFYILFFSSFLLKNVIGYGIYLFVVIVESVCTSSGITLTYSDFIGQEKYSIFLIMITFFVMIPYILPFLLMVIKKIIQVFAGNNIIAYIFKPMEALINVNVLRFIIYMGLFFISVLTYSVKIEQFDYFSLIKESLLEFVILDTVIYSTISNIKNNHKQKMKRYYIPFKYDLEFVLSAIYIYNLKYNEMKARIKFSVNINESLKWKKKRNVSGIDKLLIDISTNYYKIEILEQKIKTVLRMIIDLNE